MPSFCRLHHCALAVAVAVLLCGRRQASDPLLSSASVTTTHQQHHSRPQAPAEMAPPLVLLLALMCAHVALGMPDMRDNQLPSDEDMLRTLLQSPDRGQPEFEASLGLPSDEDGFNELHALLGHSGTHHFVSSSFPEVDARGFHEAVFDRLGDYLPYWQRGKRDPLGINSRGFHDDVFTQDFGSFHPVKRSRRASAPAGNRLPANSEPGFAHDRRKRSVVGDGAAFIDEDQKYEKDILTKTFVDEEKVSADKRRAEMTGSGFHGDTFTNGFGEFWPMKRSRGPYKRSVGKANKTAKELSRGLLQYLELGKRRMGMGPSGFHGDTFTNGFGDFSTMKRSLGESSQPSMLGSDRESHLLNEEKRRPDTGANGFHGDTFTGGFGDFRTMKRSESSEPENDYVLSEQKRRPEMDSSGFHGDTFTSGFGDFWPMEKRRPEMDSSGFHGDTFKSGFGDFWPMKKRRPEMDSSGFHGDTFKSGFGDFWTMKKRRPEMDSAGFHGDTFNGGFGEFWPVKKRRPEVDSSGFHGDTFKSGFGDFWTMKKRRPEMDSSGFHGDTFKSGFGDFWPMKRSNDSSSQIVRCEKCFQRNALKPAL